VKYDVDSNGIARVTLNRPDKFNALNVNLIEDLYSVFEEIGQKTGIKVIVVTGAGANFCAGGDVEYIRNHDSLEARDWGLLVKSAFDLVANIEIPVIAAINGLALGGGCELALACDIRVASEKARFGQPEILLGFIPGAGGTQRLARTVGPSRAKELIMTGRFIQSDEALRIGLVDRVVAEDSFESEITEMATKIASMSAPAIRIAKAVMKNVQDVPIEVGLQNEILGYAVAFASSEQKEYTDKFLNRKK